MKNVVFFENLKLSVLVGFVSILFNIMFAFFIAFSNIEVGKRTAIDQSNLMGYFVIAIFIAPFVEELMFRLPIVPNKLYCITSIAVICLVIIKVLLKDSNNKGYVLLLVWASLILLYNYISNIIQINTNYSLILFSIISSLFFAYAHVYNFKIESKENSLITLFPIFVLGILLSYIRYKAGIGWSIFTHSLINFFPVGFGILLKHFKII